MSVDVYCGNILYQVDKDYALQLHFTKTADWRLYKVWNGKEELLGGQFDGHPFCLEIDGVVIVGKKPDWIQEPEPTEENS